MKTRETFDLEFKRKPSDAFLKTVSAFANYCDGVIIFGFNDEGSSVPFSELKEQALNIENKINDNIDPRPMFRIDIDEKEQKIFLRVSEGLHKPYMYGHHAYMRRDASSVPIDDREELKRLTLQGLDLAFEDLPSRENEHSFTVLEKVLKDILNIKELNKDLLKTLGLCHGTGEYNIAADLVSDHNSFKLLDIVQFGRNINEMMERQVIEHVSILSAYHQAMEMYKRYYQYEVIDGPVRKKFERIPKDAFREAIANALVHRDWSYTGMIRVEMHDKYIQVSSPGSLPNDIREEEYLHGQASILRNEKIRSLFDRLGYIGRSGTGIRRIRFLYEGSATKPVFKIYENSIMAKLPVILDEVKELSEHASVLLDLMPAGQLLTRKEIDIITGFDKFKTLRLLDELTKHDLVIRVGKGRGTKYVKA